MNQGTKSSIVAGLLGIFLGAFGAHNWYLGEKNKGLIHVGLMGGGVVLQIITVAILPSVFTSLSVIGIMGVLTGVASLAMAASGIWGFIEGVMILTQGDAGLARKGYAVAAPGVQPGYGGQPMNNMNGYAQPMGQPMQGYQGQPMGQPMQNMDMNQGYYQNQPMPQTPPQPNNSTMPGSGNAGSMNG